MRLAALVIVQSLAASSWLAARQTMSAPEVRIDLNRTHESARNRIAITVRESLQRYGEWLGPFPHTSLRISDSAAEAADAGTVTLPVHVPWPAATSTMDVESEVAFRIARAYWPDRRIAADAHAMRDGLAWYLQSQAVEAVFNLEYGARAHSTESLRLFGGHLTWPLPTLRLSRVTGGLAREQFLALPGDTAWPQGGRRLPDGLTPGAIRSAIAFATLERYLGWPVLQGALQILAIDDGTLDRRRFADRIGTAVGRNLAWFFDVAFDPAIAYDYSIAAVVTRPLEGCRGGRCHRTDVTLARAGNGRFTGSSREPTGPFEAGEGIALEVSFEDGQLVRTHWDGRASRQTFSFEGPSPAATVRLDPDGVLLLDVNRLDDRRNLRRETNVPLGKWLSRWVVWLQDAMLAGTALF